MIKAKSVPLDVVPKKKQRSNRTAGCSYERTCAKELRELGFEHVVTSRQESRSRDGEKVDLINKDEAKNGRLPYNIQCKNSCQPVRYMELLIGGKVKFVIDKGTGKKRKVQVQPMPKVDGVVNVIFHKFTDNPTGGTKFTTKGEFAILMKNEFLNMVKELDELRKKTSIGSTLEIDQNTLKKLYDRSYRR